MTAVRAYIVFDNLVRKSGKMSSVRVKALYDFDGEPNTAEMTIRAGEIITVTRTDVGEGWWEGINTQGKTGLFPEAYVETVASGPPQLPPPMLPEANNAFSTESSDPHTNMQDDNWDDDWDEDVYQDIPGNSQANQEQLYANEPNHNNQYFPTHGPDGDSVSDLSMGPDSKGTITKKSLNRFSTFVKSGGESYILGSLRINVSEQNKLRISKIDEITFIWPALNQHYSVLVTSPKKETKLGGLKSFIAYTLTPSFNNIAVSRRYKHFDWLHERLTEKFSLIAVPPLPDKQISGRYEEQFIEHRRAQLQEFVDYVCRHPVLSTCEVWTHFLTCTDEKLWKMGKRQAEKDQLVGANFCLCIEAPEKNLLQSWVDDKMDSSSNFMHVLDIAVKNLLATAVDQTKKHQTAYKREYSKIGESFYSLGTAIESIEKATPSDLATGVKRIGTAYFEIGKIFEEQPKIDWLPLGDKLHLYKGIIGSFPDIFSIHKGALQKRKESEKIMNPAQLGDVRKRTDTLTYAICAELEHFKAERDNDLKKAMKRYLLDQVNFYKNIVQKLEDTLEFFD